MGQILGWSEPSLYPPKQRPSVFRSACSQREKIKIKERKNGNKEKNEIPSSLEVSVWKRHSRQPGAFHVYLGLTGTKENFLPLL